MCSSDLENYVDVKTLKKITPNEYIKPRTYQVKAYQNIIVENLANIKLKSNNVTFFMANRLKIERFFKDKTLENTVSHTLNVKKGEDIVISGLGFIKVTKNEEITIETLENVLVYTRKSLI